VLTGRGLACRPWFNDLLKRATTKDKKLYVVQGSNHMKLCDGAKCIDEAISVIAPFLKKNLSGASTTTLMALQLNKRRRTAWIF
jgi:uncharacterized protein